MRARRLEQRRTKEEFFARLLGEADEDDELTKASNAAVDLVQAGKYEEAAWDLITRYPEVYDGWDRLGMMHEAKGENKRSQIATARPSKSSASARSSTTKRSPRCLSTSSASSTHYARD